MTTARQLCTDAISEAGALGLGQTPVDQEINDIFTRLQRMLNLWRTKRWLVPSLQELVFTADGSINYSVGIGGDIDIQRPNDIKSGWVVQLNTGSNPVSLPLKKIFSFEDYGRLAVKNLPSLPNSFFYDAQYPLAHLYPYPIPSSQYELHFLIQSGLNFGSTISAGSILNGGTLYTDGAYPTTALTGGSGTGAIADITVTAGVVSIVTLSDGGKNYEIGDLLTAALPVGAGFSWKVDNITADIDSEIIMPDEYEEAIMYNLALRACSYYQVGVVPRGQISILQGLAKAGLATIRQQNTQIPTLSMPTAPGLRAGRAFNLYNADGH